MHKNKIKFITRVLIFFFLTTCITNYFLPNLNRVYAASTNLVSNGDFETIPFDYWGIFYNTQKSTPKFNIDSKIFHGSSGHSANLEGKDIAAYLRSNISVEPGKVYSFSAWVKGKNITKKNDELGAAVIIYQRDKSDNIISGTTNYVNYDGTFDWKQYKYNFVADSNVHSVTIQLVADGTGSVWFDDVSLCINGEIPSPKSIMANPGANRSTFKGFKVNLDGSKSKGTKLTYSWNLISKPISSKSELINSNTVNPYFIPDTNGEYVIDLTVSDGVTTSDATSIIIKAKEINDTSDDTNYNLIDNSGNNYLGGYSISDMKALADGWVIIADAAKNKVVIVNTITGEVGKEYQLQEKPRKIDFDADKNIIIATQEGANKIAKIDISKDEIKYISTSGVNRTLAFGENNIVFSYSSEWPSGKISIIDINKNTEIKTVTIDESYIGFMGYNKNNKKLILGVTGNSPSSLYQYSYDEINVQLSFEKYNWDPGSNGQDLAISSDGNHLAFACGGGNGPGYTIYDFNPKDISSHSGEWNTGAYPTSVAFSLDNKYLVATNREKLQLFDVYTHVLQSTFGDFSRHGDLYEVGISRGGNILYGCAEGNIYFYKVNGSEPPKPSSNTATLDSITVSKKYFQEVGRTVTVTANASGGSLEKYYNFYVHNGSNWELIKANSKSNSVDWLPKVVGNYCIMVQVRDKNSSNNYDDYKVINYLITPKGVENIKATILPKSVCLTWSPITGATNYNIKRASTPNGPFITINKDKVTSTTYTDKDVVSGNTYYYVITEVSDGIESYYSQPIEVKLSVPTVTFSFDDRVLKGITETMEYSLDGGKTYKKSTGTDIVLSSGEASLITIKDGIIIREAATDVTSAGPTTKITVSTGPTIPSTVKADDVKNMILGINNTMEYSFDDGRTWVVFTGSFTETEKQLMASNIIVQVRVKAIGTKLAGAAKSFTFKTLPPQVTFSFDDRILKGITSTMEYSLNGGKTYKKSTGTNIVLSSEETSLITIKDGIIIREAATDLTSAGPTTKITVSAGPTLPSTVKADDVKNIILGINNTMEYSFDNGKTWAIYTGSFTEYEKQLMAGNIIVQVRIKATGTKFAGGTKSFTFKTLPPQVTFSFDDRMLKGITSTMEYSLDGGKTYKMSTGLNITLTSEEAALIGTTNGILVREAATDRTLSGPTTKITVSAGPTLPSTVKADDGKNIILGINNTMEYSFDNGKTWVIYTGSFTEDEKQLMASNIIVQVRIKATGTKFAGATKSFTFKTLPPQVTFSFDDRMLKGITSTMEYSLDGGKTYKMSTGLNITLTSEEAALIGTTNGILVREAATDRTLSGPTIKITVSTGTTLPSTLKVDDVNNIILGINNTMEYTFDSGKTWITYTGSFTDNEKALMSGEIVVKVRIKASGTKIAGKEKIFNFHATTPKK